VAIGRGAQLLISAGVLDGKRTTCAAGIRDDVRAAGGDYRDEEAETEGATHLRRLPVTNSVHASASSRGRSRGRWPRPRTWSRAVPRSALSPFLRYASAASDLLGYLGGVIVVVLGLPLFLGYLGAVIPLVIGVAVLVRTRRFERRAGYDNLRHGITPSSRDTDLRPRR